MLNWLIIHWNRGTIKPKLAELFGKSSSRFCRTGILTNIQSSILKYFPHWTKRIPISNRYTDTFLDLVRLKKWCIHPVRRSTLFVQRICLVTLVSIEQSQTLDPRKPNDIIEELASQLNVPQFWPRLWSTPNKNQKPTTWNFHPRSHNHRAGSGLNDKTSFVCEINPSLLCGSMTY